MTPWSLAKDVRHQGEGQGVTVRQLEHPAVHGIVDLLDTEVGPGVVQTEVAQRYHPEELLPAGVGHPRRSGRISAGDHDHDVGGQVGQEPIADPIVEGCGRLVGVH